MGTNKNDCCYPVIIDDVFCAPGLTKREYFSALAMQHLIGKIFGHVNGHDGKGNKWQNCTDAIQCAELAVKYADALISELNIDKD